MDTQILNSESQTSTTNKENSLMFDSILGNQDFINQLKIVCTHAADASGDYSFSRINQTMNAIMRQEIKPIMQQKRSLSSATSTKIRTTRQSKDNSWKTEQKALFTGRGRQWIYVNLEDINPVLDFHEESGHDVSSYRDLVNKHGKAWVRYSSARINPASNLPCAAFEIRYQGSKVPQPGVFYSIDHDVIMNITDDMRLEDGKTPHQLNLEGDNASSAPKKAAKPKKVKVKKQDTSSELDDLAAALQPSAPIPDESNDFPESLDPKAWEEFLTSEGYIQDGMDDDDDIFG